MLTAVNCTVIFDVKICENHNIVDSNVVCLERSLAQIPVGKGAG